jgi:hypothetical protein
MKPLIAVALVTLSLLSMAGVGAPCVRFPELSTCDGAALKQMQRA